jgi:uncharacterized protein (TIGR02594 family)
MEQPAWLDHAWQEAGVRETPGPASNSRILQFFRDVGHADVTSDEVAWCAAFVGACLERAGLRSTRSLLARSYLDWGVPLADAKLGAVAVLSRGSDPGQGHAGFVVGAAKDQLFLLGGNQKDAVTVQSFPMGRLLGLRWPSTAEGVGQNDELFEAALAHVLEMEGGWTNDPHDPGGPTNLGITLSVFAAWKGLTLTDANRQALMEELKRLDAAAVRPIYRERYWNPSRAGDLPPALAVMHFDAAVNHGVSGAARMLQQALGVSVDGKIGPQTLAAAHGQPVAEVIDRYADIRRARYRSLSHFWRFGRGWLRRVDRTVLAARQIASTGTKISQQLQAGARPMSQTGQTSQTSKWWGHSITIWGAIITAASTVLPTIGPLFGIDITPDLVQEFGDQVILVVQAIGGLIGIIMTIYGRTRATASLERKQVTFQL